MAPKQYKSFFLIIVLFLFLSFLNTNYIFKTGFELSKGSILKQYDILVSSENEVISIAALHAISVPGFFMKPRKEQEAIIQKLLLEETKRGGLKRAVSQISCKALQSVVPPFISETLRHAKDVSPKPLYFITMPSSLEPEKESFSDDESEGEYERESDGEYSEKWFPKDKERPFKKPFYIDKGSGSLMENIDPELMGLDSVPLFSGYTDKTRRLAELFFAEGFYAPGHVSRDNERLYLYVLSNRMVSLNRARNKSARSSFSRESRGMKNVRETFRFWQPRWMQGKPPEKKKRGDKTHKKRKKPSKKKDISEVLRFYRAYKRFNKEAAQEWRRGEEQKAISVPYRSLRDWLRKKSKIPVQGQAPRYLAIFDDDLISLITPFGMGVFSYYDCLISRYSSPTVLSTGYSMHAPANPRMREVIALDIFVRFAVSTVLPLGIYFPEPNMLVLVPRGKSMLEESFLDDSYLESLESRVLMRHLRQRRSVRTVFAPEGAVHIEASKRMTKYDFSEEGFLTEQDKKNFRKMSQSHLQPLSWAEEILQVLKLVEKIDIQARGKTTPITNGKMIIEAAISMISRVFNRYDPFSLIETDERWKKAAKEGKPSDELFREVLKDVLQNYDEIVKSIAPSGSESGNQIIAQTKDITEEDEFSSWFNRLFQDSPYERVKESAKRSGQAIRYFLMVHYGKYFKLDISSVRPDWLPVGMEEYFPVQFKIPTLHRPGEKIAHYDFHLFKLLKEKVLIAVKDFQEVIKDKKRINGIQGLADIKKKLSEGVALFEKNVLPDSEKRVILSLVEKLITTLDPFKDKKIKPVVSLLFDFKNLVVLVSDIAGLAEKDDIRGGVPKKIYFEKLRHAA